MNPDTHTKKPVVAQFVQFAILRKLSHYQKILSILLILYY